MKRLWIILAVLSMLFTGCAEEPAPEIPNTMPPSVMIDGQLYQTTGEQMPGEIDPSVITGSIDEIVPGSELPSQNSQSNCGEVGMQYAFTADGLVVLLANEWTLFQPVEQQ